jgi:predicted small secreted protein
MKKIMLITLSLCLTVLLSGCSLLANTPLEGIGNDIEKPFKSVFREHPEGQLNNFLGAMENKDYTKAYGLMSEGAKKLIPEKNLKNFPVDTKDIEIQAVEFKGKSKATVYYKSKGSEGQVAEIVKENGTWKVVSFGADDNYRYD